MNSAVYFVAAYVLGSLPTGYWAGLMLKGLDIRRHGSGNMGATNVFRVLGKGPGTMVLLFDMLKGYLAVSWLPALLGPFGSAWTLAGGLAAVLGHNYTFWLGFKGGKGVATSAGVCFGLAPWATLTTMAVFGVVFSLSRMVSAGSLLASAALPLAMWYHAERGESGAGMGANLYLGLALATFVWVRHIPNIKRILNGTENKFFGEKA